MLRAEVHVPPIRCDRSKQQDGRLLFLDWAASLAAWLTLVVRANAMCVKGVVTTVSLSTVGDGTGVGVIGSCRFEVQNTK